MGKILSINISQKRGTEKQSVTSANIKENWGIEGDAHGGNWDRQVSVLAIEALEIVPPEKKEEIKIGGYTENITISGIPLEELTVGSILKIGEAKIEICRIGKEKFKEHNRPYIVSREGRFCKVLSSGKINIGDEITLI